MRALLALVIGAAISPGIARAQSPQYRSPDGVEYRSLPDTDAIKNARAALAGDPKNIARIIDLGVAQSGARQFREAITTFTRGLEIEPDNALLLRWRGHRYLSVREFDRAFADLTRGSKLDPTLYGIWYHLGVVQFLRGEFAAAAESFAKAQPIAPDAGELAGSTDWLWMSLSRAGRGADAKAMLDRRPDNKPVTNAYTRRLQLYRGEIAPDAVVTAADTDDVQVATLAYGLGNWYLVRGDKAQARAWFERSVQSGGWPGFGFIASEAELARLRREPPAGAQDVDGFAARSFKGANGVTMLYRLFIPRAEPRKNALPLVVYLHGGGGIGNDNLKQISGGNATGTHVWTTPDAQRRHPTYVLAPQLPQGEQWAAPRSDALSSHAEAVLQLIAALTREFLLDPDRVYLTGQSLGGRGTWDIISKRPDLFAAAVPLCGDGNPSRVGAARRVAIWVFHGAQDPVIPVTASRDLVAALRAVGSPVKYTEYPDVGHAVWTRAYVDPALDDWLFGQRRATR